MPEHTESVQETPPAPMHEAQNPTTGQTERPTSPERPENILDRFTAHPVARIYAFHDDQEHSFDPDFVFQSSQAQLIAGEQMKKPAPAEFGADTYEARTAQSAGTTRESWRNNMKKEIKRWSQSANAEAILATLGSLGVTKSPEDDQIGQQLDDFRKKYAPSKKDYPQESKDAFAKRTEKGLEQFAKDLIDGCRPGENQPIDLQELDKRLTDSFELLGIYGADKIMEVEYFVRAYALADETIPQETKSAAQVKIAERLQQSITNQEERKILTSLNRQHKKLEHERQNPPPQTTERTDPESSGSQQTRGTKELTADELQKRVKEAQTEALSKEETTDINKKLEEEAQSLEQRKLAIVQKKEQGQEITQEELDEFTKDMNEYLLKAQEENTRAIVIMKNANEIKTVLQSLGATPDEIQRSLAEHQTAFNDLEQKSLKPAYALKFFKDTADELGYEINVGPTKTEEEVVVESVIQKLKEQTPMPEDEFHEASQAILELRTRFLDGKISQKDYFDGVKAAKEKMKPYTLTLQTFKEFEAAIHRIHGAAPDTPMDEQVARAQTVSEKVTKGYAQFTRAKELGLNPAFSITLLTNGSELSGAVESVDYTPPQGKTDAEARETVMDILIAQPLAHINPAEHGLDKRDLLEADDYFENPEKTDQLVDIMNETNKDGEELLLEIAQRIHNERKNAA